MSQGIVVMTGATGGIGKVVCKYLATNGYKVYAGYRSPSAIGELGSFGDSIEFIKLNLASFNSVDNFAKEVIERINGKTVDIIINNAGMIARKRVATEDGYESAMQVNYLSIARLTDSLLPYLKADGGKVINTLSCTVSSGKYTKPELLGTNSNESTISSLKEYSNTKLMLALYTVKLHQMYGGERYIYGVDPGIVNTGIITMHRWYDPLANILFRPFIKSPESGAKPLINAIRSSSKGKSAPLLFKGNGSKELPQKIVNIYRLHG